MEESSVPIVRVAIISLWAATAFALLGAWVVGAVSGEWQLACLIGMSGFPALGGATVLQVRCYSNRIITLLRICSGLQSEAAAELRPVR